MSMPYCAIFPAQVSALEVDRASGHFAEYQYGEWKLCDHVDGEPET